MGVIGSEKGVSKNAKGGFKAIKEKPKEIYVWNQLDMGGKLNIYEDIAK